MGFVRLILSLNHLPSLGQGNILTLTNLGQVADRGGIGREDVLGGVVVMRQVVEAGDLIALLSC